MRMWKAVHDTIPANSLQNKSRIERSVFTEVLEKQDFFFWKLLFLFISLTTFFFFSLAFRLSLDSHFNTLSSTALTNNVYMLTKSPGKLRLVCC